MTFYNVAITTLSPIHIGDGNVLRQGLDFAIKQGRTYRLNVDTILEDFEAKLQPVKGHYPSPGSLLSDTDLENSKYIRYILRGVPRSGKTYAELRSFINNFFDRPYLPGSSIKGALRTALAWNGWFEIQPKLDRAAVGPRSKFAALPLERKIFGPNPNHDLLRAMHVGDFYGPQEPGGNLLVVNANVVTPGKLQAPVELEALPGQVEFKGQIYIDESLFSKEAERELRFTNRKTWFDEIPIRIQRFEKSRLVKLQSWFEDLDESVIPGATKVASFYSQMANVNLGPNQALLQVGWGGGWDSKTFGEHLQSDEGLFERMIIDFRMDKAGRRSNRQPGDPFPKSRRAAVTIRNRIDRLAGPFGWLLLEFSKQD